MRAIKKTTTKTNPPATPPQSRAMALCLILMTGRLGAMVGSNVVAFLLTYNCDLIFVLLGGLLLGEF